MRLIRWTPPALLVVLLVVWLPSLAVSISQYDGSYTGTLACDQIPGHLWTAQGRVLPDDQWCSGGIRTMACAPARRPGFHRARHRHSFFDG